MKFRLLFPALLGLLFICPARATWFGENVEDGADIMMMDLRYPWWGESTYNAHWNFALNSPGNFSGYGGFTMGVAARGADHAPDLNPAVQDAYRPGSVWSFWGSNAAGEPVRVVETSGFNYPRQYVGEGASGSLGGHWPIIERNRWYTMVLRVWSPVGPEADECAYVGRWVKDVAADRWHLYGIVRIPAPATSFRGNAGFLEDFGNGGRSVRSLHRRLGFYRKEGTWRKSDTVTFNVPPEGGALNTYWVVNTIEDGRVLAMELSSNRALLPQKLTGEPLALGETHAFTVEQPDRPDLDPPAATGVEARSNRGQVSVRWEIPPGAAPQLGYTVEVFDNPACAGTPLAVREERRPGARNVLLDAPTDSSTVRLTVTDIFDEAAEPVVVPAREAAAPAAAPAVGTAPGLEYSLFIKDTERRVNVLYPPSDAADFSRDETHFWVSLAELADAPVAQRGICRGFDTTLRGAREHGYGFRFEGYLTVPTSGLYLFHMAGTDGYRITLDGTERLVRDGLFGPETRAFEANLAAGAHPIRIDTFVDKREPFFRLEWEGPGFSRCDVPGSALTHEIRDPLPEPDMAVRAEANGVVAVTVRVRPNGHTVDRIRLFLGALQIAAADGAALDFRGLLPAGEHRLWTRVFHDGNCTLDSPFTPVRVGTGPIEGWNTGVAGEADAVRNILQRVPDGFAFVGDGESVLYRSVTGDFSLTCRIDACLGPGGEPVNPSSWVGLSVREFADRNNYRWGREFGIMQTAGYGLRTTPDWSDGGASRMSVQVLPEGRPWLRVVRRGALWTAWTSADGAVWHHGATHFKPMNEEVGAGIVFRALPQDAQMVFRAEVSNVTLVPGVPDDVAMPEPVPADGLAGADLTGIVASPSDPRIAVARSASRGLLRTDDGGLTWRSANGALKGAANAVRSVAIHPTDPATLIRACGRVDARGAFEGGLYRTTDAGAGWEKLPFPGDFDGVGPSAVCGEVVAFSPHEPGVVLAGTETRGLFRSTDGGDTWAAVIPPGPRFTTVAVHPWHLTAAKQGFVHALTCADRWMPLLGRGAPAFAAAATLSADYVSHDGGTTFRAQGERADLGYLSLGFSDFQVGTFLYGTTHGLFNTFSDGRENYLVPDRVPVESNRPLAALAVSMVKSQTWPRVYAQVLAPAVPGRVSRCDYSRDNRWRWHPRTGPGPDRLIAIAAADLTKQASGDNWWFLGADGLYRTDDDGVTFRKVLE